MGTCSYDRRRKLKKNNFNKDINNHSMSFNTNNNSYNKDISKNSEVNEKKRNNFAPKDKIDDNDIHNIKPEKVAFPRGEHYYQLIKGSNKSELIKKEDYLGEKVELFFSLTHVKNPNDEHSFRISIINNIQYLNLCHLGKLENRTGEKIEFSMPFLLDFYFWRDQKVIIEPIINNNIIENKKEEFALSKLMKRMDNRL